MLKDIKESKNFGELNEIPIEEFEKDDQDFTHLFKWFDQNEEGKDQFTKDQLEEMIVEHERLIKLLEPLAQTDKKVEKELSTQKSELENYKSQLKKFRDN